MYNTTTKEQKKKKANNKKSSVTHFILFFRGKANFRMHKHVWKNFQGSKVWSCEKNFGFSTKSYMYRYRDVYNLHFAYSTTVTIHLGSWRFITPSSRVGVVLETKLMGSKSNSKWESETNRGFLFYFICWFLKEGCWWWLVYRKYTRHF